MQILKSFLLAVAVLFGTVTTAADAQTYPKFTGLVVDAANVLPPATEADLTAKLEALQKDTKRQLIVATIPSLEGRELEEYGVGLGRAWGVGLKDVNNGAILFIAPNEPKGHRGPRIEVGYGLEPFLTDAFTGRVIREQMIPKLSQSGDIPGAMEAGTDALIKQLRASPEEAKAATDAAAAAFDKTHRRSTNSGGGIPFGLIFWGMVIGFVLLSALRRRGGGGQQYRSGIAPAILWGATLGGWGGGTGAGGGGGWGGGSGSGGSDGGSDGSWGGGGFTGGGGGSFGGGGASGDW
ncbi:MULTISPECIES: TPM domain-containing protein [unclassified Sphingomonas]|uniref:TPM domain-containing protein n=1 Tax=unclassified Sphingomonas TaxID=196159 RepID=UPI001F5A31F1|nr:MULTISPECIES: TPM domain-containing protein [unclassified Sphingomonas]